MSTDTELLRLKAEAFAAKMAREMPILSSRALVDSAVSVAYLQGASDAFEVLQETLRKEA